MTEPLPIFALHGWALNAAVFAPFGDRIAGRRLIAPDLPGHGRRREETLGRDPAALASRLLDEAPPRAVWLGWSLGSLLALAAASAAPERVAALVLVAGTASFIARPDWPQGMPRERLESMGADLVRDPEATVNDFLTWQVQANARGRKALRGLRQALAERGSASAAALADGLALLEIMDYRGELKSLKMPALAIAGGRDRLVRPQAARASAVGLPGGRFLMIEEAGHAPFLSHADEFHAALSDFLAALDDE
ncbi:MAG: alpha/beta fold hydrolase [Gammaproteobacteria bacterium]